MKIKHITLTILFSITACCVEAQTTMRYKMAPGDLAKYKMNMGMDYSSNAMGQDISMHADSYAMMEMKCENADAKQLTCMMTLDTGVITMQAPDELRAQLQTMGMDSVMPLDKFMSKHMRTTLTPSGKVVSIIMLDTPKSSRRFGKMFSGGMEKYSAMFNGLPDAPVKPGDTWTDINKDSSTMNGMGTMYTTTNSVCTFLRTVDTLQHHCAVIGVTATITIDGEASAQGMSITASGGGKSVGTTYFDYNKGCMVATNSKMESTTNIAISGAQNMEMPQTITATMEMTMVQ